MVPSTVAFAAVNTAASDATYALRPENPQVLLIVLLCRRGVPVS
jgi:hypothetical protein